MPKERSRVLRFARSGLSSVLLLPALLLCTTGILYVGLRVNAANELLDVILRNPWTKPLLSPVVVIGGPAFVLVWHLTQVCQLKVAAEENRLVVVMSIRWINQSVVLVALGGLLLALLLSYAFVENFQIVAR